MYADNNTVEDVDVLSEGESAGIDNSGSEDPEIDFNPRGARAGSDSLYFGSPHDTTGHSQQDMGDTRVRLQAVETAVHGINSLLATLAKNDGPPRITPSQPSRDRAPVNPGPQLRPGGGRPPRSQHPPANDSARLALLQATDDRERHHVPRSAELRGPHYDDFIQEQLRREEFLAARNDDGKGIVSDIYVRNLSPKPYMYLDRPGLNTVRKKLDARQTMTYQEYVCAYLKMVRDPRANQSHLVYYHLEHLQQIAEDALKREWAATRDWSQKVLDEIEKGSYDWADSQTIQLERLNMALNYPRQASQGSNHQYVADRAEGEPCKDFNSDRGCAWGKHHGSGGSRQVHSCSYCYAQTARFGQSSRHCFHDIMHCKRREVDLGITALPQTRSSQFYQGNSKNGR